MQASLENMLFRGRLSDQVPGYWILNGETETSVKIRADAVWEQGSSDFLNSLHFEHC